MKVLITSIGKRIQLIKYLKRSLKIIGTDSQELIPAKYFVEKFYKVPRCEDEEYIEALLNICKLENINMIIPLYEKEFIYINKNRNKFEELNIEVLLSTQEVVNICNDKIQTYSFFSEHNIKSPKTYEKIEIERKISSSEALEFPMIVKPCDGMGSANVFKVNTLEELKFFINYVHNPIIQEFITGNEYTIDALVDLSGNIISIVPRIRLEVRSGEVSKSKIEKNINIIKATENLINKLNRKGVLKGPLTIQCILNSNEPYFIEINCRFGGGVPLSLESGIDYGKCFEQMYNKEEINRIYNFKELTMLRFDDAVFIEDQND